MRGFMLFVNDLEHCRSEEEKTKRVNKELGNIRNRLGKERLNWYQKKKYVCKILFMFLQGYKCDFGSSEAADLMNMEEYKQKRVGYLFLSVITGSEDKLTPRIIALLKNDLTSDNSCFQNLALQFIANSYNKYIAASFSDTVLEYLFSDNAEDFVRQTAAITLLQLFRLKPDFFLDACDIRCITDLISSPHLGFLTASISLIDFLARKSPVQYQACLPLCVRKLEKLVFSPVLDFQDHTYYKIADPWLTVKLLRFMRNFSAPTEFEVKTPLRNTLDRILDRADEPTEEEQSQHVNAKYAVIFEAISLIVYMDLDAPLKDKAFSTLGKISKYTNVNLRFMSLDIMARLADRGVYLDEIRTHWQCVVEALRNETDITVRKEAAELLYNICDREHAFCIVEEMLNFIEGEPESSHDAILKATALAKKFSSDFMWYVDTVFTSLRVSRNFAEDDVWYTLVRVIAQNDDDIREYAAKLAFNTLQQFRCNDMVMRMSGQILGDYGHLIAKYPRSSQSRQLKLLRENYPTCSHATRSLLLSTFMKFLIHYPELKEKIQSVFRDKINIESSDIEVQKRASEYYKLSEIGSKTLLATAFGLHPAPTEGE